MNALLRALAPRASTGLAGRLDALRRDATIVVRDLLGRSPPPFMRRGPLPRHQSVPQPAGGPLLPRRGLLVERVVHETREAVSLYLTDPSGEPIAFEPGQFLTLQLTLPGGRSLKRAYSLSSVPAMGEGACRARITVKRVAQGAVSNHLNEHVREGDTLTVLGPSGQFGVPEAEARGKHLLLIGGGSGITPLRSIFEARLADPTVTATLLYGNRAEPDILFRAELDAIALKHASRSAVRHVLEAPPPGWTGGAGRLDRATSAREIESILGSDLARGRVTEALVCGPTPMMDAVRGALHDMGFPAARIREEQFSSPEQRSTAVPTAAQPISLTVRGRKKDTIALPGQTLLEAGLAAGMKMPFSCAMGGCGACKAKLVSGRVIAEEPNCLSREEAAQGLILACVSRAAEPVTLEIP